MDDQEQTSTCSYDKFETKSVDMSSEDEYQHSSCYSELIPIDTRKLWLDIAQIIKSIYRDNQKIQLESELSKIKEYIQILTQANAEILFEKIESIVLEHVTELRHQLFKHSQTYLQLSNDVQSFITYLLDQYNTFIQSAKHVSNLLSYLEENYLKSLHLTWLLYNKHLYETYVYMNKKIQQSMSLMIDLLQPTNELSKTTTTNDCSPAVYTHLLNRFLAFDEEISETACLYKDCQNQKQQFFLKRKQKLKKKKKSPKTHSNETIEENRKATTEVILPPKLPPKFQNDLRTVFTKTEIPPCPSLLTAKIQSVSFTAGTFGSITTNDQSTRSTKLDELIRQATSQEKICDLCCCNLLSDSTNCLTCMSINDSLPMNINQRETERKERLRIKLSHKRTNENLNEHNQSSIKPNDNSIEELVKYIDGNDSTTVSTATAKKNKKKKKNKQRIELPVEENEEQQIDPPIVETIPLEKVKSPPKVPTEPTIIEQPLSPDEEVNWTTISRKQNKPKSQPVVQSKVQPTKKLSNSNPKTTVQTNKCESIVNSNKSQMTSISSTQRAKSTVSPWTNQEQNTISVASTSNLVATAPVFVPSSTSINRDVTGFSPVLGPVQRPNTSFSPAPGSQCIRRPSPTNSTISNSNSDEFLWKYSSSESSIFTNDFPLYDPFNSGASLKLLTNRLHDRSNDIDDMDALEKEIEHFKKSYIEKSLEQ